MDCLVIFSKYPEKGKVKTRLAKDIGNEAAEDLAESFLVDLSNEHYDREYDVFLAFSPESKEPEFREFLYGLNFLPQKGFDIWQRMYNVFKSLFKYYKKIVLIKSDVPNIQSGFIVNALGKLDKSDIVLGATQNDDIYLIGMKNVYSIFPGAGNHDRPVIKILAKINSLNLIVNEVDKRNEIIDINDIKNMKLKDYENCKETCASLEKILKSLQGK